jgi:pimeloyl-ACP methyl ester carboxylesterase
MTNKPWVSGGTDTPDPDARQYTVETSDGHTLGVAEYGPEDGFPIFGIHGTPGSRYGGPPPEKPDLYERLNVRLIGFDRAGYGLSTRRPDRVVADAAGDVAAIADHLGIDKFAVEGGSGGGPHSLAVATLLPERVTRCACIVGVAPLGDAGLARDEWLTGMTQGNVDEFSWSTEGEAVLRPNLERLAAADLERLDTNPSRPLGEEYELSEGDEEILSRPAYAQRIRRMMQESYRAGVDGWVDDDLVFVKDWGFDIADLTVPTTVWYGEADTLVPAAHGRWLAANVPGAIVVQMGGGHMELVDRVEELLVWLLGGAAPKDAVPGTAA